MKILVLIFSLNFIFFSNYQNDYKKYENIIEIEPSMVSKMRNEIIKNKILFPEIVLRQAIWETGWFKCKNCSWRFNNAFGFRTMGWVSPHNPLGYIEFDKWQNAVAYYKQWQERKYKGGDYYNFLLKIGYAEDGQKYIDGLKSIKL